MTTTVLHVLSVIAVVMFINIIPTTATNIAANTPHVHQNTTNHRCKKNSYKIRKQIKVEKNDSCNECP